MTIPSKEQCEATARTLKALSHPDRLRVLCFLADGEKTVNELMGLCDTSQSLMSQFLTRLKREGYLANRREGGYSYYRIKDGNIGRLMETLHEIYGPDGR